MIARRCRTRSAASRPRGGTAILDCLEEAAQHLAERLEGRHAIVLITDGYDEHSTQQFCRCARARCRRPARPCTSSASAAWPGFQHQGRAPAEAAGDGARAGGRSSQPGRSSCSPFTSRSRPTCSSDTCSATHRRTRRSTARGGESSCSRERQRGRCARARLLCAQAAAGAAVARVHDDRRESPSCCRSPPSDLQVVRRRRGAAD